MPTPNDQPFAITTPYHIEILHDIWRRWVSPALNHTTADGFLRRAIRIGNENVLIDITAKHQYRIIAQNPITFPSPATATADAPITDTLVRWLGADIDNSAFYAYCQQAPHLAQLIQPLYGVPVWRTTDMFEALIFPIIEQHINWQAAQRAQTVLVKLTGDAIDKDGTTYYAMPTAHTLSRLRLEDLYPLKITYKRMQLILDIAQSITEGTLQLEPYWHAYQHATTEAERLTVASALYKRLLMIKGIGHWTAANTVMRSLGIYPYVLHNDVALQAAVGFYFYAQEGRVDVPTLKQTFAPYGAYAGLVAHFTLLRWVLDRYPVQGMA